MKTITELLKSLSDRNRLRILHALFQHQALCACQITALLQVKGATASRHLRILSQAGLIESQKKGRWIYFRIRRGGQAPQPLMRWLRSAFEKEPDIQKDRKHLKAILSQSPEIICHQQRGDACCPPKVSKPRRSS